MDWDGFIEVPPKTEGYFKASYWNGQEDRKILLISDGIMKIMDEVLLKFKDKDNNEYTRKDLKKVLFERLREKYGLSLDVVCDDQINPLNETKDDLKVVVYKYIGSKTLRIARSLKELLKRNKNGGDITMTEEKTNDPVPMEDEKEQSTKDLKELKKEKSSIELDENNSKKLFKG